MTLSARHFALFVAAVIPFAILPLGMAGSVGPLARLGARWCDALLSDLPRADPKHATTPSEKVAAELSTPAPDETTDAARDPRPPSRSASLPSTHRPPTLVIPGSSSTQRTPGRRASSSILVGPDSIERALPPAGRPTSSWTDRTAQHPAGLLIQSPGALAGLLEPGDILIEAEGQPLGSVEQLLVTVRQAYDRRARRLSGRLFRNGDLVRVSVEPGW